MRAIVCVPLREALQVLWIFRVALERSVALGSSPSLRSSGSMQPRDTMHRFSRIFPQKALCPREPPALSRLCSPDAGHVAPLSRPHLIQPHPFFPSERPSYTPSQLVVSTVTPFLHLSPHKSATIHATTTKHLASSHSKQPQARLADHPTPWIFSRPAEVAEVLHHFLELAVGLQVKGRLVRFVVDLCLDEGLQL